MSDRNRPYPPAYWDRDEVAYHLGISPKTLDEYVRTKKMPAGLKLPGGSKPLWRPADIDALLTGRVQSDPFEIKPRA